MEKCLHVQLPPWTDLARVTLNWSLGTGASRDAPDSVHRATAEALLSTLPTDATSIWSDGSAEGGTTRRGGRALLVLSSGDSREVRVAVGSLCSSTRAELFAMRAALEEVSELTGGLATGPVVLCTDSQAALALLTGGAGTQETPLGAAIWDPSQEHPRPPFRHQSERVSWRQRPCRTQHPCRQHAAPDLGRR